MRDLKQNQEKVSKLTEIIKGLINKGFWGHITIRFQEGEPKIVDTIQSTKL